MAKNPVFLVENFKSTENAYLKYFKNRIKFNNYRKKLVIILFFAKNYVIQGKTIYQFRSLILQSKKIERTYKKLIFWAENSYKYIFFPFTVRFRNTVS